MSRRDVQYTNLAQPPHHGGDEDSESVSRGGFSSPEGDEKQGDLELGSVPPGSHSDGRSPGYHTRQTNNRSRGTMTTGWVTQTPCSILVNSPVARCLWPTLVILLLVLIASNNARSPLQAIVGNAAQGETLIVDKLIAGKIQVGMDLPFMELSDAITSFNLTKKEGLFNLVTLQDDPAGNQLLWLEVHKSLWGRPFLVSAMFSKADGMDVLYHLPAVLTDSNVFQFVPSEGSLGLDLVSPNYGTRTGDNQSQVAVDGGAYPGWLASFSPVSYSIDSNGDVASLVIDFNSVITQNGLFVFPIQVLLTSSPDQNLEKRISSLQSFKENINIDLQFSTGFAVEFSLRILPETPMIGRVSDDRIGYFTVAYDNVGYYSGKKDTLKSSTRIDPKIFLIKKWRIAIDQSNCNVLTGVTYHIDPSVPERWWKYMVQGIEEWNTAFTPAVIGCQVKGKVVRALTPKDSDFPQDYSAADARHNSISWAFSKEDTFALGPSDVDPRSGEILNADIVFTHGWIKTYASSFDFYESGAVHNFALPVKDKYSCAVAGNIAEAALLGLSAGSKFMSDEDMFKIIGAGIKEVAMHEVGHTLGLRHNFKASAAFSMTDLQNEAFVKENGLSTSVMDYLAINVQRDPSKQTDYFSSVIGAYDKWAIRYGYSIIAEEQTGVKGDTLSAIADEVESNPWLKFGTDEDDPSPAGMDPKSNTFDLTSNPLDFYQDRVMLVNDLRRNILDRTTSIGDNFDSLLNSEKSLLRLIESSGEYSAKYIGGFGFSKAHRSSKVNASLPIELPCPHEQRKALGFVCQILSNDSIVFPSPAVFEYLVQREGVCDGLNEYCFGTSSFDVIGRVSDLRWNIITVLLDENRLRRMQNNLWAQQNSTTALQIPELFQRIGDSVVFDLFNQTPKSVPSWRVSLGTKWIQQLIEIANSLEASEVSLYSLNELDRTTSLLKKLDDAEASMFTQLIKKGLNKNTHE